MQAELIFLADKTIAKNTPHLGSDGGDGAALESIFEFPTLIIDAVVNDDRRNEAKAVMFIELANEAAEAK